MANSPTEKLRKTLTQIELLLIDLDNLDETSVSVNKKSSIEYEIINYNIIILKEEK